MINKIHPIVLKACKNNKVSKLAQIATINDYLLDEKTKGNIKQSYLKNHPNASPLSAEVEGSKTLSKPKIQDTIQEILETKGLDKNTIIDRHNTLYNASFKKKDFTNAVRVNQDFLKMHNALDSNEKPQIAIQVNNNVNKMNSKDLDDAILRIINE